MRSSLILGVTLLLTIAGASIIQAHEHDCTCNRLGSGINPCKCGDVVVKAARVEKPLYRASAEAINEAAVAREVAQRLSIGTVPGGVASFPTYSSYGDASGSISHSSSSSSSLSSVGLLGKLIGGSGHHQGHHYNLHGLSSGTGCGCGRKSTLRAHDILSHNTHGKIVPSFPPIGDLCYPNSKQTKLDVTTRVTPAYPAKPRCCPPTPHRLCMNVMDGQIGQTEIEGLGLTNPHSHTGLLGGHEMVDGSISGRMSGGLGLSSNFGGYGSSAADSVYGSDGYSGHAGLSVDGLASGMGDHYSSSSLGGLYGSGSSFGGSLGSSAGSYAGASGAFGSSAGSYASSSGSFGSSAGSYAGSSMQNLGQLSTGTGSFGGYGISDNLGMHGASHGNAEAIQDLTGYRGSGCNEFGDDLELPKDYSYPRLPADPVSLTLAYKNLFPHVMLYNRKGFVPEDKLAFGHRTVPAESVPAGRQLDVPEEKLQIVDRPVVELKPVAPVAVSVGVYDEQEEVKLAELEAIERERINQEAIAEQSQLQTHFITYGDLGYAPVNGMLPGRLTRPEPLQGGLLEAEDVVGGGCGPLGPPAPGYIPGNIVVDRETMEVDENEDDGHGDRERTHVHHYGLDYDTSEEEDIDGVSSGIFARLRHASRKHGAAPCFQNPL